MVSPYMQGSYRIVSGTLSTPSTVQTARRDFCVAQRSQSIIITPCHNIRLPSQAEWLREMAKGNWHLYLQVDLYSVEYM